MVEEIILAMPDRNFRFVQVRFITLLHFCSVLLRQYPDYVSSSWLPAEATRDCNKGILELN